jgi:hypothetical protein
VNNNSYVSLPMCFMDCKNTTLSHSNKHVLCLKLCMLIKWLQLHKMVLLVRAVVIFESQRSFSTHTKSLVVD